MRAFVFTDPALASTAGRYVWLDVDTERTGNAPVLEKFPVEAWPTYFVVDPRDERVLLRWVGAMTVSQAQKLMDEGLGAFSAAARTGAAEKLARADRLYGEGKNADAAKAYREALAAAPADWPHYGRAVEALLFALSRTRAYAEAVDLAREALPRLAGSPHAFAAATIALDSALGLAEDGPKRAESVAFLEADVRKRLADSSLDVAADDRSGAYDLLLQARKQAKDETGARGVAEEWARYLEGEAARARTPEQRMVFDPHRLTAYLELGQPERAISMLEASERDAPDDYNPPARLAVAYQAMKRWDAALAASERALARVYGRRKLRVLTIHAEIQQGKGDTAGARRTLEQAIAYAEGLPAGQRSDATVTSLKKKLETIM